MNEKNEKIIQIYKNSAESVYRYSLSKLNDKTKAEDVTSETFTRLLEKHDIEKIQNHTAWVIGIARNIIYEKFRELKNDYYYTADQIDILDEDINYQPDNVVINREDSQEVLNELNKLDNFTKEVIILKIWEELQFNEISELLGKNLNTIKTIYYKGIQQLKRALESRNRSKSSIFYSFNIPVLLSGIYTIKQMNMFKLPTSITRFIYTFTNNKKMGKNNTQENLVSDGRFTDNLTNFVRSYPVLTLLSVVVVSSSLLTAGVVFFRGVNTDNSTSNSTAQANFAQAEATITPVENTATPTIIEPTMEAVETPIRSIPFSETIEIFPENTYKLSIEGQLLPTETITVEYTQTDAQKELFGDKIVFTGDGFTLDIIFLAPSDPTDVELYDILEITDNSENFVINRAKYVAYPDIEKIVYLFTYNESGCKLNYSHILSEIKYAEGPCNMPYTKLNDNSTYFKIECYAETTSAINGCDELVSTFKFADNR